MSLPSIPSDVAQFIKEAATATKLPESVVAAQNYVESGYGSDEGPSSTGAMGPWQFEPTTWANLGYPAGEEDNWSVSTQAYSKYMNQLLSEEHGNVRNALAAYNAGPGNLSAGYGYADQILSLAGQSGSITTQGGGSGSDQSLLGNVFSWPTEITDFFKDADTFVSTLLWLVNPASWVRIGAFGIAILLLLGALFLFSKVGSDNPIFSVPNIPVPIPAP